MKKKTGLNMADVEKLAHKAAKEAKHAFELFPEMSKTAVELHRGKRAVAFQRWVSVVHPYVKSGASQWDSVNEFIAALYKVTQALPTSPEAVKVKFEEARTFYNNAKRAGDRLRNVKEAPEGGAKPVDVDKLITQLSDRLSKLKLSDAVKVVNALRKATGARQSAARARAAKRVSAAPTVESQEAAA